MSIHITGRRIAAAITAVVAVGSFATAGLGSFVLFRGSYHTASSPVGATQAPSPQQTPQPQPPTPQQVQPAPQQVQPAPQQVQPAPQQPAPQPVAPQPVAPQPVAPSTGGGSSATSSGS